MLVKQRICVLGFCILSFFSLNAQEYTKSDLYIKNQDKISTVYKPTELNNILENSPNKLVFIDVVLNQSFEVVKNTSIVRCEDLFEYIDCSEISQNEINNQLGLSFPFNDLNLLLFSSARDSKEAKRLRIGNTGYDIILLSSNSLIQKYNTLLNSINNEK